MNKSCLDCKYQPEWGRVEGTGVYQKQYGNCKWFENHKVIVPACADNGHRKWIQKYLDNSGVFHNCATWETAQCKKSKKP